MLGAVSIHDQSARHFSLCQRADRHGGPGFRHVVTRRGRADALLSIVALATAPGTRRSRSRWLRRNCLFARPLQRAQCDGIRSAHADAPALGAQARLRCDSLPSRTPSRPGVGLVTGHRACARWASRIPGPHSAGICVVWRARLRKTPRLLSQNPQRPCVPLRRILHWRPACARHSPPAAGARRLARRGQRRHRCRACNASFCCGNPRRQDPAACASGTRRHARYGARRSPMVSGNV
mmetsp:Transcript_77429/g.113437  ORF Transcript_77429/g.113437 Transcript_77429/m.113437 type:complete len:237 (+) Transcript_77429:310-1020(+)